MIIFKLYAKLNIDNSSYKDELQSVEEYLKTTEFNQDENKIKFNFYNTPNNIEFSPPERQSSDKNKPSNFKNNLKFQRNNQMSKSFLNLIEDNTEEISKKKPKR